MRSIRLVLLMNGVTAALGLAQVLLTWTAAQRGAVLPMLVIGLAMPAAVRLPWQRIADHRLAPLLPAVATLSDLCGATYFLAAGPNNPLFYPVAYVVIMMYATVACSSRVVGAAGVLSVVGFVGLTTVRGGIAAGLATALSGTLIVVTSLCVVLAHNREVRETDRRRGNKRMQAIGQHASDGVLAVDQTGRIGSRATRSPASSGTDRAS